jgi:hypothetical protein
MASEPSRCSEVGKRMSRTSIAVITARVAVMLAPRM